MRNALLKRRSITPCAPARRLALSGGLLTSLVVCAASASSAAAAVPYVDIGASGGPLTHVAIGADMSCQVQHTGDSVFEFFPSSATPADCGTLLFAGGTLFAPNFASHDRTATSNSGDTTSGGLGSFTPFTQAGQSAKSGTGSGSKPFRVVTNATAGGTGLALTETDSYTNGQESYRSDVTVRNGGSSAQPIILYRAGDCYLQNSDVGYGFTGPGNAVGCSANANNSPAGRIEEWVPITQGNTFLEAKYSDVWGTIGARTPFPNSCARCSEFIDNGAGISWSTTLQPGQSATFSHYTTFSPAGISGPPPPPPPEQVQVPPSAVGLPSSKKCVDRRHFKFTLHSPPGQRVVKTQVYVNGKLKLTRRGNALKKLTLSALPKKKFVVKIVDTTDAGVLVISKRTYRGCKKSKPHTIIKRPRGR
ncbi:MAG: hypothetical protein NVSMB25_12970 [Thermoleophilaceae bacterium]